MRLALLSDLHGNEIALEAVLEDAAAVGVDRIVCLGDVATLGPRPGAVLARLRQLQCPTVLGNHDEFLLDPALIRSYTQVPVIVGSVDWCRQRLSADDLEQIRAFQRTLSIDLGPRGQLLLFHGSPRSHMEDLLATTPAERLDEALAGHEAAVLAGGHTHIQMLRQHRGRLLINPGSVGMPFREYASGGPPTILSHAEYATLEVRPSGIAVTLRRVELDRAALRAAAAACDNPLAPELVIAYS